MNAVDQMLVEQRCQKLIFRYAMLTDQGDWDGLSAMFTEEASFARPTAPDDVIVGRDNILASFRSRKPTLTQHIVSNVLVSVESESKASASSVLQLFIGTPVTDNSVPSHANSNPIVGRFHDKFELVGDCWLFSERRGILTIK